MAKPKITRKDTGYNTRETVKIATSNLFIETGEVPVDYMVGAIFNEIGGQEFLAYEPEELLTRPNTFPIKNISENIVAYSSTNLLFPVNGILSTTTDYAINLNNYLLYPSHRTTYDISSFAPNPDAYISEDKKDLVILVEDEASNFYIEIEFLNKKP
jgi:hypothetical protein